MELIDLKEIQKQLNSPNTTYGMLKKWESAIGELPVWMTKYIPMIETLNYLVKEQLTLRDLINAKEK